MKIKEKIPKLVSVKVLISIELKHYTIKTRALIDTSCINNVIDRRIVPKDYWVSLTICTISRDIGGRPHYNCDIIDKHKIRFIIGDDWTIPQHSSKLHIKDFSDNKHP